MKSMRTFTTSVMIALTLAITILASCSLDEPDGKWSKMKWKDHSGLTKQDGTYFVPASGGTYTFECLNYSSPWIASIGEDYLHSDDFHSYTGSWFAVECKKQNVTITVQPLDEGVESRNFTVTVTAGDIFDTFRFTQQR